MDAFIGEIRIFSWNWPPVGWLFCNGAKVSIQQYQVLYAVIGRAFGGDGTTYFNLPNLMGQAPMGAGNAPPLPTRVVGQSVGSESVAFTTAQMPSHAHNMTQQTGGATNTEGPTANTSVVTHVFSGNATKTCPNFLTGSTTTPNSKLAPTTLGVTGKSLAHENRQPLLAMNFCICIDGTFPVRP